MIKVTACNTREHELNILLSYQYTVNAHWFNSI